MLEMQYGRWRGWFPTSAAIAVLIGSGPRCASPELREPGTFGLPLKVMV